MKKIILLVTLFTAGLNCLQLIAQNKIVYQLNIKQSLKEGVAKNFESRIFHAALGGQLRAYKDDSTTKAYKASELKDLTKSEESIQVHPDPNDFSVTYDSIVKHELTDDKIADIVAYCTINPDAAKHRFTTIHNSYGLAFDMVASGFALGIQSFFWFKYEDLSSVLNPDEMLAFKNAVQNSDKMVFNNFRSNAIPAELSVNLLKYIKTEALVNFDRRIYSAATRGIIIAFEDNNFKDTLKVNDITTKTVIHTPANVNEMTDTINMLRIEITINPDSIIDHQLITKISLNEFSYICQLSGIAFFYGYKPEKGDIEKFPVYCISFDEINKAIGREEGWNFYKICYKALMDQLDMYNKIK